MTEAMPFLQNYDITFLRPPPILQSAPFCFFDWLRGTAAPVSKTQSVSDGAV